MPKESKVISFRNPSQAARFEVEQFVLIAMSEDDDELIRFLEERSRRQQEEEK